MFDKVKRIVARYILLEYADFNKHFGIHTDEINYKIGALISQRYIPITCYSQNITGLQNRYTVIEK